MSLFRTFCIALLFVALAPFAPALAETVQFKASDGLEVTGEVTKPASGGSTAIVLFHQAGSSRGEYKEIAPRLAKLGYTVLAVDQRSGNHFDGVKNKTAKRAKDAGKATAYTDALPDLKAAATYARDTLGAKKVVLWGSSYSAALAIVIAGTDPKLIDGVLAFSPGEYFGGKPGVCRAPPILRFRPSSRLPRPSSSNGPASSRLSPTARPRPDLCPTAPAFMDLLPSSKSDRRRRTNIGRPSKPS